MDESLDLVRRLLAGDVLDHSGEHFHLEAASIRPTPDPAIPIVVGGRSPAALRRTGRLGDGWLALWVSPDRFVVGTQAVAKEAEAAGREIAAWQHGLLAWCGLGGSREAARRQVAPAMEDLYQMPFDRFERYTPPRLTGRHRRSARPLRRRRRALDPARGDRRRPGRSRRGRRARAQTAPGCILTGGSSLRGRVALVTGAGRGLGRAHALALAARGASVVVNDLGVALDGSGRDEAPATRVTEEIVRSGGRAVADATDVASIEGGAAAVTATVDAFGRIDIVVNNAGFASGRGTLEHPSDADYDGQLAIHLKAAIGTTGAALPHMKRERWGRIVNTVSEVALDARFAPGGAYAVAKGALWAFTVNAAAEAAPHGVTVNAISPGATTRMSQGVLGATGDAAFRSGASEGLDLDPAHVARVVAWLCSDEAGDVNGRILHAAAGQVREYTTLRSARTELAQRVAAIVGDAPEAVPC